MRTDSFIIRLFIVALAFTATPLLLWSSTRGCLLTLHGLRVDYIKHVERRFRFALVLYLAQASFLGWSHATNGHHKLRFSLLVVNSSTTSSERSPPSLKISLSVFLLHIVKARLPRCRAFRNLHIIFTNAELLFFHLGHYALREYLLQSLLFFLP